MIIIDVNILLYLVNLVNPNAAQHDKVVRWWERTATSGEFIGVPSHAILAFLRIATNPRAFATPLSVAEAVEACKNWLALPSVRIVDERDDHLRLVMDLVTELGTARDLVTDAHYAALAISHDATLISCDSDFAKFPGLRWINPLEN